MSTSVGTSIGDDPSIPPDVGIDPTITSIVDPFADVSGPVDPSAGQPLVYGPTLAQLGATTATPGIVGSSDPPANNSHPSTAAQSGSSVLDDILGIGKISLGVASAISNRGGAVNSPVKNSISVANAKSPLSGAGTSSFLMFAAIALFVGLFAWAELKH